MLIPARLLQGAAFWRCAARDRRGVAALEFALIAPLMILLFVGLAQLSSAIIASRHTSHADSSLGDLVSQCSNISDSDLNNIFSAASDILAPLPISVTVLNQRVSSVMVVDANGTTQAQWSQTCAGAPGTTTCSASSALPPYAKNQAVTLPANLVSNQGDSVIMSETKYVYNFPIKVMNNLFTFDDLAYFKPRKSTVVTYTGLTSNGGTGTQTSCYSS